MKMGFVRFGMVDGEWDCNAIIGEDGETEQSGE